MFPISGSLAWSRKTRRLLIWNLLDGMDLYRLHETGHLEYIRTFQSDIEHHVIKLVDFVQDEQLVASGTDRGEIILWDAKTGKRVHSLGHGPRWYSPRASPLHIA